MPWPDGKRFALTFVDDTDKATVENVGPVYALLGELGLRTTKTVWPLPFTRPPLLGGSTLEEAGYRAWVLALQARGFEIAMHGATDHSSTREETIRALDRFREVLGRDPRMHVNHVGQKEQVYWGADRLDGIPRVVYRAAVAVKRQERSFHGHDPSSPYFWGDVCRERVTYVRNFVFPNIETTAADPIMPYHDPRRPYVRYWYSASDGTDVIRCNELLGEEAQDRLAESGGACIVYTHFANGFVHDGRVDARFEQLLRRVAALPGWFVPASDLLDHLRAQPGWVEEANRRALRRMQRRWLASKLLRGTS